MNRRRMLRALAAGGVALASTACGLASSSGIASTRLPRIGYLSPGPREDFTTRTDAFLLGLKDLGYVDGQNLSIEWRFAASNDDSAIPELADLAADLVQRRVDLIVTDGNTLAALAAKHATSTIPVVFAGSTGPIEAGLVNDLARPGGNVTGLSNSVVGVEGMYIQLLRDVVPNLQHMLDFVVPDNPALTAAYERTRGIGEAAGIVVERVDIRSADQLEAAFETPQVARCQAMLGGPQALLAGVRARYAQLALEHHLPSLCTDRALVQAGFLMCYGPDQLAVPRRAATYVDKILRGARPGDLPVEQPTVFELIVNTTTARALGVTLPPPVAALVTQTVQ